MQADTSVRVGTLGSVFQIAFNRTSYSRQLAAYLMMPSRFEVYLQKRVVFALNECFITQDSLLGVFGTWLRQISLVMLFATNQPVFETRFRLVWRTLDNRPIGLFYLVMCLEHSVEPRQSLACSGKEHYPARRSVQTMRHTEKDLAGLVVLLLDIGLDHFTQRRVARLVALHNLIAGLVDGNNMVVLV